MKPYKKTFGPGDKSYHDITEDIARPIETRLIRTGGLHLEYLWLHLCGVLDV